MSSGRELKDWIGAYLKYTENTEPPISYHTWIAISLIAGALQRKTYMVWGHDIIYPNLYVVLIGPSGRARKGTAMNIGEDIIRDIGINLTSESITREALIRDMKESIGSYNDPTTGKLRFQCPLTAMSGELSVFLGQNDVKFLADLTDWYDSKNAWTYRTKGAGTHEIQGVCFNLLGATAPDWLQSILPQEAIGGGFTSRIIFVVEENKGKTVAEPILTKEEKKLRDKLTRDLERIATIAGEMAYDGEGKKFYIDWYTKHEELLRTGKHSLDDPRFSGYLDRRATHMRKVAQAMSASRGEDRVITKQDLELADAVLSRAEAKMHKTFGGLGRSVYSDITEKVLNYITSHKRTTRSDLMRKFYRDMDPQALEVVEKTLTHMKLIKVIQDIGHSEVIYEVRK